MMVEIKKNAAVVLLPIGEFTPRINVACYIKSFVLVVTSHGEILLG